MNSPRHQQLTEALLARIADGTYALGDRLPTEAELCAEHGLARGTVRKALGRLDQLGLISRRPGAGTTVVAPAPVATYQPVAQSADDIATLAAETRLVAPETGKVRVDAGLARRIGTRSGAVWFVLQGPRVLRGGDGIPLCWSEHYLRGDLPPETQMRRQFTVEEVARTKVEQTISAGLVADHMADGLMSDAGGPALVITRRHRDAAGRLVSVGIHTHPADRYTITMTL